MNICGCLVHAVARAAQAVRDEIEAIEGAEIHAASDDGRFVVVVEDTDAELASDKIMSLHHIPGVMSVTLTYHHFEDLSQPVAAATA